MGVRGIGGTKERAFEQAALAVTGVITDLLLVRAERQVELCCSAPDDELLLADWLNAVIYEMTVCRMLFSRFEVKLEGNELHAKAYGEPVEGARHRPAVEVKGATYTALSVRPLAGGGWLAQCVVDV